MSETSIYAPRPGTILCRVLSVVARTNEHGCVDSDCVAGSLGIEPRQASRAMSHLARKGLIARVGHGLYQTRAWAAARRAARRAAAIEAALQEVRDE